MDDIGALGFGETAPHAVRFLDGERVISALFQAGAAGANLLGVLFAALAFANTAASSPIQDPCHCHSYDSKIGVGSRLMLTMLSHLFCTSL